MIKTLFILMIIIYFLLSLGRRKPAPPGVPRPGFPDTDGLPAPESRGGISSGDDDRPLSGPWERRPVPVQQDEPIFFGAERNDYNFPGEINDQQEEPVSLPEKRPRKKQVEDGDLVTGQSERLDVACDNVLSMRREQTGQAGGVYRPETGDLPPNRVGRRRQHCPNPVAAALQNENTLLSIFILGDVLNSRGGRKRYR